MSALVIAGITIVCFKADNEIVSLIALIALMLWGFSKIFWKEY